MRAYDYRAKGCLLAILRRRGPLIGRGRSLRRTLLILAWRRTLLILAWRRTLLILARRRTLLILAWRRSLLILIGRSLLIAIVGRALLHAALTLAHLRAMRAHLLTILTLLIAVKLTHDLTAKVTVRLRIARASLRMRLRILMNQRLNSLLLIAGEVQVAETLRPAVLEFRFARHGVATIGSRCRRRALLCVRAERHGER
jgi:hypothetical protein